MRSSGTGGASRFTRTALRCASTPGWGMTSPHASRPLLTEPAGDDLGEESDCDQSEEFRVSILANLELGHQDVSTSKDASKHALLARLNADKSPNVGKFVGRRAGADLAVAISPKLTAPLWAVSAPEEPVAKLMRSSRCDV